MNTSSRFRRLCLSILMSFVMLVVEPASVIANASAAPAPDCTQVIAEAVAQRGAYSPLMASADVAHPHSEVVVDFGHGCRLGVALSFFASGGRAKAAELLGQSGTTAPAYPEPASPASEPGGDPYCYMHSWQTDCCGIQTWAADVYQFWDNWVPCCPSLVNPYAVQRYVTDPFFVNTRNDAYDSWLQYAYHVQADGYADFYSSAGPTGDGVHHWVDAYSDHCGGAASFWGATVPGGSYHNVGPNGPYN